MEIEAMKEQPIDKDEDELDAFMANIQAKTTTKPMAVLQKRIASLEIVSFFFCLF
jgi:hypothetical protein